MGVGRGGSDRRRGQNSRQGKHRRDDTSTRRRFPLHLSDPQSLLPSLPSHLLDQTSLSTR